MQRLHRTTFGSFVLDLAAPSRGTTSTLPPAVVLLTLAFAASGCGIGVAGARARVGAGASFGPGAGGGGETLLLKTGITPVAWFDPEREWDIEAGYALEVHTRPDALTVQGGYLGLTWLPVLAREYSDLFRVRFVGGVDAELMGGVDRLAGGVTATVGFEVASFTSSFASRGSIGQGFAIGTAGEWALGVALTASYRYAEANDDDGHYGVLGGVISVRFPSALASGYVLPLAADQQLRGETDEENAERHRRRQMLRRQRRGNRGAPSAPVVCFDADQRSEADTLEEGRRLCPGCACEVRTWVPDGLAPDDPGPDVLTPEAPAETEPAEPAEGAEDEERVPSAP